MVSPDDLNDWVQRASELEWLMEQIGDAVLNERINLVAELSDHARPIAHFLTRSMVRAGAADPDASEVRFQFPNSTYGAAIEPTEQAQRAAETLERAALLVLALEKELGIRGMGEALADFAAELSMFALKEPQKGIEG